MSYREKKEFAMKKACSIFLILMLVICTMAPMAAFGDENDGTQTQDPGQSQQQQQDTGGQSQGGQSQQQDTGGQSQGGQSQQQDTGGQSQGSQSSGGSSSQGSSSGTKKDSEDTKKDEDDSKKNEQTTEDRSAVTMKKKQNTENPDGEVSIIFTGDIHSHLDSQNEIGGFAKMKTQIDDIEKTYPDTFIFDAGGFSMGTAFQTIYISAASELRMMGQLDYDAVTLGDHEFDYRVGGLGRMLNKAAESKRIITTSKTVLNKSTWRRQTIVEENQFMPEIVCANINWEKTLADKDFEKTGKYLRKSMKNYGVCDYTVIDKGGVRVAVFGLMGEDAVSNISTSGVKWDNYIERAKAVVGEIKRNKEADIIVCLSHSGYSAEEGSNSEDAQLAKEVPDIDLIISGHAHEALKKPVKIGDTIIAASGQNTNYLGHLTLKKKGKKYRVKEYKLYRMGSKVNEDYQTKATVQEFRSMIDSAYFNKFGFSAEETLARSDFDFTPVEQFAEENDENSLGNIVADSFKYAAEKAGGADGDEVACAIVQSGTIKGTLGKGDITAIDAFDVCATGMGNDGRPGYPLVSMYLTGKELKMVPEVDASLSGDDKDAILHMSGLTYGFNDHRVYLNKAVDIRLEKNGTKEKIVNNKMYRVVTGLETCRLFEDMDIKSHGLLQVVPKDKNGNEITDFKKHIIRKSGRELKEWYALALYLDSFDDDKVPAYYEKSTGREVDETSIAPWQIIKQPNNYGVMMIAMFMIPVVILIGIALAIRNRRRIRRGYEESMFDGSRRSRSRTHRMGIEGGRRKRS